MVPIKKVAKVFFHLRRRDNGPTMRKLRYRILKLTRQCATIIFAHSSSLVFAKPLRRSMPLTYQGEAGNPSPTLPVPTALGRIPRRPRAFCVFTQSLNAGIAQSEK